MGLTGRRRSSQGQGQDDSAEPFNEGEASFWYQSKLPQACTSFLVLAGVERTPSADQLASYVGRLPKEHHRFGQTPREPWSRIGPPRWVDIPPESLGRTCRRVRVDGDWDEVVALLQRLQRSRHEAGEPLWSLTTVETRRGAALVLEVEHCVADGATVGRVLKNVGQEETVAEPRPAAGRVLARDEWDERGCAPTADSPALRFAGLRVSEWLPRLIGRLTGGKAALSTGERGILILQIGEEELANAADKRKGGVNDLLIAILTLTFDRYRSRSGKQSRDVRVCVPVNLRPISRGKSNNNAKSFSVDATTVPLTPDHAGWREDITDIRVAVLKAMRQIVRNPETPHHHWWAKLPGLKNMIPGGLHAIMSLAWSSTYDFSATTMSLSQPISIGGEPASSLWGIPCTANLAGIMTSYCGQANIAIVGSPTSILDWERYAECLSEVLIEQSLDYRLLHWAAARSG